MNRATPHMRSIAQLLIKYEMAGQARGTKSSATFQVTERLRPHLAMLMGNGGFRALVARALVLASAEVSWLRSLHVGAGGTLEGLELPHAQLKPAEFLEGRVVLVAQLLGLLVAFIGPSLTSRLVGEVWPQLSADNVDFGNGDER